MADPCAVWSMMMNETVKSGDVTAVWFSQPCTHTHSFEEDLDPVH